MIGAMQCRQYAAECNVVASSSGISKPRSLEQRIMALNWTALADEIDRERAKLNWWRALPWVTPIVFSRLTHPVHKAGETDKERLVYWGA